MKFLIDTARGSYHSTHPQPIEGAVRDGNRWYIEIATLEELLALMERAGHDLVLSPARTWNHNRITIYDDYLE